MKHFILYLTVLTLFILSSTSSMANADKGKGKSAEKGGGKAVKEAASTDETAAQQQQAEQKAGTQTDRVRRLQRTAEVRTKARTEREAGAAKEAARGETEKAAGEAVEDDSNDAAGKGKGQDKGKSAEMKGKGQGKSQQTASQAKQIEHELQKHQRRQARLQDMLKVAQDKGDEKAVERIQSLIDKETARYEKKRTRMTERQTADDAAESE